MCEMDGIEVCGEVCGVIIREESVPVIEAESNIM